MSRTAPPTTYAFTRISPAGVGLVGGYELGLAARGFAPLAHRGQLSDRVAIALRRRRQRHGVSFKARDYGRIEGVGDREAAEEQLAAGTEAAAAFGPDLDHAIDVLLRLRRHALAGMAAADVHPHRAAQRLEARMHLGADRARRAPRLRRRGPELLLGMQVRHRFADRERIPHRLAVNHEHRHFARRRVALDALRPAVVAELELD